MVRISWHNAHHGGIMSHEQQRQGLHDCPCVLLSYDHYSDAQGNLVNQIPNTISMMPEVTEIVACPTFVSHMPNRNSY